MSNFGIFLRLCIHGHEMCMCLKALLPLLHVEFTFKTIVIPLKSLPLVYVGAFQTIGTIGIERLHCT
jgi:hypothetical protein